MTDIKTEEWWVYVITSTYGKTYVGCAKNIDKRIEQHNGKRVGGAKSTRGGRPWVLSRTLGPFTSRGEAQKVEFAVKSLKGQARVSTQLQLKLT